MVHFPSFVEDSIKELYNCNSNSPELASCIITLQTFISRFPEPTVLSFVKNTDVIYYLSSLYDAASDEKKIIIVSFFEALFKRKFVIDEDGFNSATYKICFSLNTTNYELLDKQLSCLELAIASGNWDSRKIPADLLLIPKLVALLGHPHEDILQKSINSLGYLYGDDVEDILELSVHCGVLNHFNLLFHKNSELVSKYLWLMSNIATSETGADLIIQTYGFVIPYIQKFIKSPKKEISYWAFKSMGNIFGYCSDDYQIKVLITILKPETTLEMVTELERDHKRVITDPVEADFYLDIIGNVLPLMEEDVGGNEEPMCISQVIDTCNKADSDMTDKEECNYNPGTNKHSTNNLYDNKTKEPMFNSDITKSFLKKSLDLDFCKLLSELKQNPEMDESLIKACDKVLSTLVNLYKFHLDVDIGNLSDGNSADMQTQ